MQSSFHFHFHHGLVMAVMACFLVGATSFAQAEGHYRYHDRYGYWDSHRIFHAYAEHSHRGNAPEVAARLAANATVGKPVATGIME